MKTVRRRLWLSFLSVTCFWWIKWHWNRIFSESFGFPLSVSFSRCSVFSRISSGGWTKGPLTAAFALHRSNKNTWFIFLTWRILSIITISSDVCFSTGTCRFLSSRTCPYRMCMSQAVLLWLEAIQAGNKFYEKERNLHQSLCRGHPVIVLITVSAGPCWSCF
jgi:hypothetical protein